MREIMEIILPITERDRMLMSLPWAWRRCSRFPAIRAGRAKTDAGPGDDAAVGQCGIGRAKSAGLTLEGLGITPELMEAIAPQYLWRFRPTGQFQRMSV